MKSQDSLRTLTRSALFTAIALTIFMIESRLPAPLPISGAKLGLSNCVTIYVAYAMGVKQAGKILFARIVLAALFAGQLLTLLYSATGGLFCLGVLALLTPKLSWEKIWFLSPCCAVAHNFGQVLVASYVMGTREIFYFIPYLFFLAMVSGLFVGVATQHLMAREKSSKKNLTNH